jgi:DNA-binding MarR family transcriptional regulator
VSPVWQKSNFTLAYIALRYKCRLVTRQDYRRLATFRYELRKFLRFSELAAGDNGLTPQQYQAMLAIEGFPERNQITIGELAEQMQIAAHSSVGLVNRLEKAGLIERQSSDEDRRCVLVRLTKNGRERLKRLASVHRQELERVGPLLVALLSPEK